MSQTSRDVGQGPLRDIRWVASVGPIRRAARPGGSSSPAAVRTCRIPFSSWRRSRMPAIASSSSRRDRTLGVMLGMPRRRSLKRELPANSSQTINGVQRRAKISPATPDRTGRMPPSAQPTSAPRECDSKVLLELAVGHGDPVRSGDHLKAHAGSVAHGPERHDGLGQAPVRSFQLRKTSTKSTTRERARRNRRIWHG